MVKKIVMASALVATLTLAGSAYTNTVYAGMPNEPGKSETKNNESAEKNNTAYWEAQYPGSTCKKTEYGNGTKEYTVPALPSGTVYSAIIVKAGSESSVGEPNKVYESPTAGQKLTAPEGKDISHVIVCTKPAGGSGGGGNGDTPPTGTPVTSTGTPKPTTTTQPAPRTAAAPQQQRTGGSGVASLPVTSGGTSFIMAAAISFITMATALGTYAFRANSLKL